MAQRRPHEEPAPQHGGASRRAPASRARPPAPRLQRPSAAAALHPGRSLSGFFVRNCRSRPQGPQRAPG
eukprot:13505631-Alexandrium_andersonii.AAC.1